MTSMLVGGLKENLGITRTPEIRYIWGGMLGKSAFYLYEVKVESRFSLFLAIFPVREKSGSYHLSRDTIFFWSQASRHPL